MSSNTWGHVCGRILKTLQAAIYRLISLLGNIAPPAQLILHSWRC
jgi:hypothetical protein